jgi:hypothetical protein
MKTLSKSRKVNRRATFKSRLDIRTSSKELLVLLKSVRTNKKLNGTCFITRLLLHYLLFYLWIDNKSRLEWFGCSHSLLNLQTTATFATHREHHLKAFLFIATIVYATTNVLIRPLETYTNIISHFLLFVKYF